MECSPACAAHRIKRRHITLQADCGNVNLYTLWDSTLLPYIYFNCSSFKNSFSCCELCRIQAAPAWGHIRPQILSHDQAPHQAHLLSSDHFPLREASHTVSPCQSEILKRKNHLPYCICNHMCKLLAWEKTKMSLK